MKIGVGISTKLIFMVTTIVVTAIAIIVTIATDLFQEESLTRVQEMNKDVAESFSEQVFTVIKDVTDKTTLMAETVIQAKNNVLSQESQQLLQNVLKSNDEIISFSIYRPVVDMGKINYSEIYFSTKEEALAEFDLNLKDLKEKPMNAVLTALSKKSDQVHIVNLAPVFGKPLLSLVFLTKENAKTKERWLVRCEIRQEPFIKLFKKKSFLTAYITDFQGRLLVHSDAKMAMQGYDYSIYPIVQKHIEGKLDNHQMEFEDQYGNSFIGAFRSLGIGGAATFAQVEKDKALAAVHRVQYRALLVTCIVVGFAFILNFIFSQSMTSPLSYLYWATNKIAEGQFDVKLEPQSNDEIGALTVAFKKMAVGLQERDKLKNTFSKFHSKEIAQKILSGEIKLGGERKVATVFFSDIRNFTSMSEKMSPDEVVRMLNEYMTEMVKIIYKYSGVVDKYVGDAIMALWGIPNLHSNDAYNAVCAALEMRAVMKDLNSRFRSRGQHEIKIGIGLHTGEVLAGNIGSNERLEYTVIGDTVNQASRIESSNKELSSDILISDTTCAIVKSRGVVVGPPLLIKVKGKDESLTVHQVIGIKDSQGITQTVLSKAEQDMIMNQTVAAQTHQNIHMHQNMHSSQSIHARPNIYEDKTVVTSPGGMGAPMTSPTMVAPSMMSVDQWMLARNSSHPPEGPYSSMQVKMIAAQPGFPYNEAMVFKPGDPQMMPLSQMPIFSRRQGIGATPISAPLPPQALQVQAESHEWYIYGTDNQTYGPYTIDQIQEALAKGHITRTTYCWNQAMPNWIYVYQIPGFDRRAA